MYHIDSDTLRALLSQRGVYGGQQHEHVVRPTARQRRRSHARRYGVRLASGWLACLAATGSTRAACVLQAQRFTKKRAERLARLLAGEIEQIN